ncbi:hypothetical protein CUJ83_10615 [Methanocella sp. CWC-04]|uniref:Uncharacterized protein n=2 Tax=Methanooceanicella nereidis TaxID=2052831 RepID=A0AAP2W7V6_9EURY|nr:hypothetical protein [Methanocella sp. CWC-04]
MAGCLILLALIMSLTLYGLNNAVILANTASVDAQLLKLKDECKSMLLSPAGNVMDTTSTPGLTRKVSLTLPDSVEYVSFGFDPCSGNSHEGTIYYNVAGTKKAVIVDERVSFRESSEEGSKMPSQRYLMITSGGRYEIIFELVYDPASGKKYLVSYDMSY